MKLCLSRTELDHEVSFDIAVTLQRDAERVLDVLQCMCRIQYVHIRRQTPHEFEVHRLAKIMVLGDLHTLRSMFLNLTSIDADFEPEGSLAQLRPPVEQAHMHPLVLSPSGVLTYSTDGLDREIS